MIIKNHIRGTGCTAITLMDPTRKKARTQSNADSVAMASESIDNMDISDSASSDDDRSTDSASRKSTNAGMDTSPDTGGGGDDDIPQKWRNFFDTNKTTFQDLGTKQTYVRYFNDLINDFKVNGASIKNGSALRSMVDRAVERKNLPGKISIDQANEALKILYPERQSGDGNRGVRIVDGLDRELAHEYDLNAFERRIEGLFKWHNDERECTKYNAPYFALIQSSGMGKTKLFTEYRKLCLKGDTTCITILCVNMYGSEGRPASLEPYYDYIPTFETIPRDDLKQKMDNIIEDKTGKIVLLFDEAQGLMKKELFSDIRWWLREERQNKTVVAAFAGTTAKLSKVFPPDGKPPEYSRNTQAKYKNLKNQDKQILYPPFFRLHTISCLRKQKTVREAKFPDSVIYGRPMFAHYHIKRELDDKKLEHFANRLVLSSVDYKENLPACYSVLGSRVQMGIVNRYDTLTELVSSGYACLVEFTSSREAQVTFMPDPLCAFLAMRLMNGSTAGKHEGQGNEFWVQKARCAFETKLCRPDKGDAGEIFAALYMLFCGDHLRKQKDASLRTFSVKLGDWFYNIKSGGKNSIEADRKPASKPTEQSVSARSSTRKTEKTQNQEEIEIESTISFIQVCRNDYRSKPFFKQNFLEHLYLSGLGIYAYSNCPAFDIVSSIRVKGAREDEPKYHPLLVSVKNWEKATNSDVSIWKQKMEIFIEHHRVEDEPSAVCIILSLGCSVSAKENDLNETHLSEFPEKDVYRLVSVPEDDKFGIFKAIQTLGRISEESELYSSHGFAACEASAEDALRTSSSRQDEVAELFQQIGDGHSGTVQELP